MAWLFQTVDIDYGWDRGRDHGHIAKYLYSNEDTEVLKAFAQGAFLDAARGGSAVPSTIVDRYT